MPRSGASSTPCSHSTEMRALITSLRGRDNDAEIKVVDHAYWVKGCSSLGRLRYAALIDIAGSSGEKQFCFLDVKEAVTRGGAAIGFSRDAPGQCRAGGDRRAEICRPISASACWPGGCKAVPSWCASCCRRT